jgi:uncharacterized protein
LNPEEAPRTTDTFNATHGIGIHVVAKPAGPLCNLNCDYCFYLEKQALFGLTGKIRMSDDVLSAFIKNYITSQPTPIVEFVWQGGEPTLLEIDFFEKVVELQRPFTRQKVIKNSLQTNGTLLTDEWCAFMKKHNFMVGISLDGPREIHDRHRCNRQGKGTFEQVMRGLRLLQKHRVDYNVLACVAHDTAAHPLDIYRFFKDEKIEFIQFTPIIERVADVNSAALGLRFASPALSDKKKGDSKITPWTIVPEDYGDFLIAIYEEWVKNDVGKIFVMNFEWALNAWIGNPSPICIHAEQCGQSVAVEYNGDVYACDHCVYPQYKLGNIVTDTLTDMISKSLKSGFGVIKKHSLPRRCEECEVLAACRGGCPKHRFASDFDGEPGFPYLCAGYRKFFLHIRKYLKVIATLLENGLPASYVMDAVKGPLVVKLKDGQQR